MNTLTGLIPTIYEALDIIRREQIGFIFNVSRDSQASGAAVGQSVRSPVVPQGTLEDIVAGVDPASSGDHTIGNFDVKLTDAKAYPIRWNGEETLAMSRYGQYNTILANQFAQGFRTLSNACEASLASQYLRAAQAVGTAGTTPFGTKDDHMDFANANKALDDLGAPSSGRVMMLGSSARANVEGIQSGLFHVNEAGDAGAMLRNRQLRELHGFTMGKSAGITSHTAGTGTGYLVNGPAGKGEKVVNVDTGTGTILPGDQLAFNGVDGLYGVRSVAGGVVTLNDELLADVADDAAITITPTFVPNMFFHESALLLATRTPAMPEGGDSAQDVMTVTDPVSGMSFQVALYRQYKQVKYEIGLVWGAAAPNAKFAGVLLG